MRFLIFLTIILVGCEVSTSAVSKSPSRQSQEKIAGNSVKPYWYKGHLYESIKATDLWGEGKYYGVAMAHSGECPCQVKQRQQLKDLTEKINTLSDKLLSAEQE